VYKNWKSTLHLFQHLVKRASHSFFCHTFGMSMYAEIAFRRRIPHTNDGLFTFAVPTRFEDSIIAGCIVLAALRGEFERGVVVRLHDKKPLFDTEEIVEICTPELFEEWQFGLADMVAKKNFVSLARVLPLLLPNKIFLGNGMPPKKTLVSKTSEISDKKLGKNMEAILEALTSHPRNTPPSEGGKALQMELQELLQQSGASKQTLQRLQEKGLVELKTVPVEPQEYQSSYDFPSLSDEQKNAFQQLQKSSRSLLFAPTGSGKSHLLRMLADGILRQKKTALLWCQRSDLLRSSCRSVMKCLAKNMWLCITLVLPREKRHVFFGK
jgi:primosomal protein N'